MAEDSPAPARRQTARQRAVRDALRQADGFVSAQQLHRTLADQGVGAGLTTVYRQLNILAEQGEAHIVSLHGEQLFRDCSEDQHHHHLICERCGRAVNVVPPIGDWLESTARDHGFTVSHHQVEVFGLCTGRQD
jgi:Fur family ferric uptake transcriptional regulator